MYNLKNIFSQHSYHSDETHHRESENIELKHNSNHSPLLSKDNRIDDAEQRYVQEPQPTLTSHLNGQQSNNQSFHNNAIMENPQNEIEIPQNFELCKDSKVCSVL